jgi:hypothetical protein
VHDVGRECSGKPQQTGAEELVELIGRHGKHLLG